MVELITVITILSIMVVIAIPSFASMLRSSKVRGAQSELIASMMLARSEAVKRGVPVSVVATAPAQGREFSAGWTVFIDADADGQVGKTETVIRNYPDISSAVTLASAGNVTLVTFAPTGFLASASAASFTVCGKNDATPGYLVSIQPVGLADVSEQAPCL